MITPETIRAIRKLRGLTLQQAAEQIGVTRDTVWRWEKERRKPRGLSAVALAKWCEEHKDHVDGIAF